MKPYSKTECGEFRVGDVLRLKPESGTRYAFSDMVILGFDEHCNALLARPYAYAEDYGTDMPKAQVNYERVEAIQELLKHYDIITRGQYVF